MERKINRKINTQRKRLERWYTIATRLSGFEGLINCYDGASPEEIRTMKTIHAKLYECSILAGEWLKVSGKFDNVRVIERR